MSRDAREVWAKRIERWKDSGLTAREFAAETGINANSLTHWRWKLTAEAKPRKPRSITPAPSAAEPHFVEVVTAAPVPASALEPIEVVLVSGLRLRVPIHFDETALRRLVVVLEAR